MTHEKANSLFDAQQPKWCALFVRVNQEKRVKQHLEYRGIDHFLPTYRCVRNWKDRRVQLERPLFPGYVFIRLAFTERLKALTIPNVLSIVGTNGRPSVISENEINWIRRSVETGSVEPYSQTFVGARVTITHGALSGMEGAFLGLRNKGKKARVSVSIDSIQRAFVVEVDSNSVATLRRKLNQQAGFACSFEAAS